MKTLLYFIVAILTLSANLNAATYKVETRYPIAGTSGWDYITIDSAARRLYVSHATQVEVLDADTGKAIGVIADTPGVHGIVIATNVDHGFTTNGKENKVSMFDAKTLALIKKIDVGQKPDGIHFDKATGRVFTNNHGSHDISVIDSDAGVVVGTVAVNGDGEGIVSSSDGLVFVNLEDKSEVVAFDAKTLEVKHRFPIDGGKAPTGLAMDRKNNRLFIACHNQVLVVMDATNGKTIATLPIGKGPDAAGFDREDGLIFVSNGDGTLNVIHEQSPDQYESVQTVETQQSAKTMAFDGKTKKVFLPAADVEITPATDPTQKPTKTVKEGTFAVLVVSSN
ncbi:MAG: YncE family protein [Terracidiphilus sp.]